MFNPFEEDETPGFDWSFILGTLGAAAITGFFGWMAARERARPLPEPEYEEEEEDCED